MIVLLARRDSHRGEDGLVKLTGKFGRDRFTANAQVPKWDEVDRWLAEAEDAHVLPATLSDFVDDEVDHTENLEARCHLKLLQELMWRIGGDHQEIGTSTEFFHRFDQARVELARHNWSVLLVYPHRESAMIGDDHGRITAVAALGKEALRDRVNARFKVHRGLGTHAAEDAYRFHRLTSAAVLSKRWESWSLPEILYGMGFFQQKA